MPSSRPWGRLGIAVLYTTHYMEEAAKLCDRIGIIDDGHLVAEGTADSLIAAYGGRDKVHLSCEGAANSTSWPPPVGNSEGVHDVREVDGHLELTTDHGPALLRPSSPSLSHHCVELTGSRCAHRTSKTSS